MFTLQISLQGYPRESTGSFKQLPLTLISSSVHVDLLPKLFYQIFLNYCMCIYTHTEQHWLPRNRVDYVCDSIYSSSFTLCSTCCILWQLLCLSSRIATITSHRTIIAAPEYWPKANCSAPIILLWRTEYAAEHGLVFCRGGSAKQTSHFSLVQCFPPSIIKHWLKEPHELIANNIQRD